MADRPTKIAEYRSRCSVCDEDIEEGEAIALLEDDGEWVHTDCADEVDG